MTSLINQGYPEEEVYNTFDAAEADRDKSYTYQNGQYINGIGEVYGGSGADEWRPIGYDDVHKVTIYQNGAGVQMSEKDLEAKYGKKYKKNIVK